MKKLLTFILICTILAVSVVPAFANSQAGSTGNFSDVPAGYWAYDAIKWMSVHKIVEGAGDGKFLPNRPVTRDEYAKMMVLTLNLDLINPQTESFMDIKRDGWQFKYIETAKPYMTGFRTSDGAEFFHPSEAAVREDMAVALVKALGFNNETADLDVLNQFTDAASISVNLKKYVALAVQHKLMEGYDQDGKRVFGAKEGLDRASAATLLYNAFKENEEKITFDDEEEKVTYDNEENDTATEPGSSNIKVSISGDKALVSWDKITSPDFSAYKVVVSRSDSTPAYPENGYLQCITDRNSNSIVVKAGDSYNGGDIGGSLKAGVNYYFSITVLYNDGKASGNVVQAKLPGIVKEEEHQNESDSVPDSSRIQVNISGDKAIVSWDKITSPNFVGYKVVISRSDSTPVYPDNGYLQFITDRNNNSIIVKAGDGYNGGDIDGSLKSDVYYYFSITVLYNDKKVAGNVVRAKLP